jgi:hypothetical protein
MKNEKNQEFLKTYFVIFQYIFVVTVHGLNSEFKTRERLHIILLLRHV